MEVWTNGGGGGRRGIHAVGFFFFFPRRRINATMQSVHTSWKQQEQEPPGIAGCFCTHCTCVCTTGLGKIKVKLLIVWQLRVAGASIEWWKDYSLERRDRMEVQNIWRFHWSVNWSREPTSLFYSCANAKIVSMTLCDSLCDIRQYRCVWKKHLTRAWTSFSHI